MDASSPAPWTFAGRAAYFGERVCPFCDHRARARARFCDACGSPLDLKPCSQCDAVNHHAATRCYQCGGDYPAALILPEERTPPPAADLPPSSADAEEEGEPSGVGEPPSALSADGRLFGSGQLFLAYVGIILIAGAYAAYRVSAATPDAAVVASQPALPGEGNAQAAVPAVAVAPDTKPAERDTTMVMYTAPEPTAPQSEPVKPQTTAAMHMPVPATKSAGRKHTIFRHPVQSPATKHASAPRHAVPKPDPWQGMHVGLAQCKGDLIDRMICDQRVRRRFCEGHWGEVPECADVVAKERGQ